jgi:hypothetical protein
MTADDHRATIGDALHVLAFLRRDGLRHDGQADRLEARIRPHLVAMRHHDSEQRTIDEIIEDLESV